MSVYVDERCQGQGIGKALVEKLKEEAVKCGFWSLFAVVLADNEGSRAFHKSCGFREIGYKEKIAKDRFGVWQNSILFELRL